MHAGPTAAACWTHCRCMLDPLQLHAGPTAGERLKGTLPDSHVQGDAVYTKYILCEREIVGVCESVCVHASVCVLVCVCVWGSVSKVWSVSRVPTSPTQPQDQLTTPV